MPVTGMHIISNIHMTIQQCEQLLSDTESLQCNFLTKATHIRSVIKK